VSHGTTSRLANRSKTLYIESFDGRLGDELLNETLFSSLAHAREALTEWRLDYNTMRRSAHRCVGLITHRLG
jgi:transposase InsO family protein